MPRQKSEAGERIVQKGRKLTSSETQLLRDASLSLILFSETVVRYNKALERENEVMHYTTC